MNVQPHAGVRLSQKTFIHNHLPGTGHTRTYGNNTALGVTEDPPFASASGFLGTCSVLSAAPHWTVLIDPETSIRLPQKTACHDPLSPGCPSCPDGDGTALFVAENVPLATGSWLIRTRSVQATPPARAVVVDPLPDGPRTRKGAGHDVVLGRIGILAVKNFAFFFHA